MTSDSPTPLIVGAGPTGLAAALFLKERGVTARIIERDTQPSVHSKALGVNPRTLDLLQPSGVTERMFEQGHMLKTFNVWRPERKLATLNLGGVDHRYPFMLVLPQSDSEALLADAVTERGVVIDRGVALENISATKDGITAVLSTGETLHPPAVLAADGAHSTVRKALGRDFPGSRYPETWMLWDAHLRTTLDTDAGHAFLLDGGVLLLLPLRDDLWRIVSNVDGVLESLPEGTTITHIDWQSEFGFAHRIAAPLLADDVCLAGDAAHIHSAFGARGMNLGIEDAFVFAALYAEGRLGEYETLRRPVIESVVHTVARLTEMPRGRKLLPRLLRKVPFLISWALPRAEPAFRTWLLGLDHDLGVD